MATRKTQLTAQPSTTGSTPSSVNRRGGISHRARAYARRVGPTLEAKLPDVLWRACRASWYLVRDWREYRDGVLFDVFHRQYRIGRFRFEVPRAQTRIPHRARFWRDTHELEERKLIERHLPADATVLELGACLGVVSVVLNSRLANPKRHVALEANPQVVPVLTRNRDANGAQFQIEPALLSKASDGTFFVADLITTSSASTEIGKAVKVPLTSIEELEARHGLRFDAVVMDIQGAEHLVLQENPELLSQCRCVIVELHPHIIGEGKCEECRELMKAHGLQLAERYGLVEAWVHPDRAGAE